MYRFRLSSSLAAATPRLPRGWERLILLAALVVLAVIPLARADAPDAAAAAPAAKPAANAAAEEALAVDRKIIADAKAGSEIMANLGYLSDVIGPRLTGSAALKRANEWTAEKMKSYGLSNVHLEAYSIPMGWERGTASARLIEPGDGRALTVAAAGWSPGTKGQIQGDVVVLNARSTKDLAAFKGKLKNAIVLQGPPRLMNMGGYPGRPPRAAPGADGAPNRRPPAEGAANPRPEPRGERPATPPPGADNTANPRPGADGAANQPPRFDRAFGAFRRELADFLRTEGAAVILHDSGKPHGLLVMSGGWRGNERADAADPLPSLYVAHEHYALLYRLATRTPAVRTRVEIEVTNKLNPGPIAVYNTVGEIRGREKPDEFVVVGAHLDSWDLAQGTTDNGTGSAIVLEAARLLAKSGVQPKRTIRFVLFSGEEQGLHGSKAYVKQHQDEMPRTSMCLVHDTGTGRITGLGLQGRAKVKPVLEPELVALKDVGITDINLRSMGGSDHLSFEQAGVPGFAFQQDMSEYGYTHHTQTDTFDKAKEAELIQGTQAMAVIARRVADLPDLLPREKPARQQRAER
jgi:hypothetical protein